MSTSHSNQPLDRPVLPIALLESARQGDSAAMAQLLILSQPDMHRFARRACKVDDIDDAIQETLIRVNRRLGALRVLTSFSTWMFSILRRECQRIARRAPRLKPGEPTHQLHDQTLLDTQLKRRTDEALRLDLAAAISSLPEHYRVLIMMRDLEERSIDDIASATSLTREAVKGRINRARIMLREYLKDLPDE